MIFKLYKLGSCQDNMNFKCLKVGMITNCLQCDGGITTCQ